MVLKKGFRFYILKSYYDQSIPKPNLYNLQVTTGKAILSCVVFTRKVKKIKNIFK